MCGPEPERCACGSPLNERGRCIERRPVPPREERVATRDPVRYVSDAAPFTGWEEMPGARNKGASDIDGMVDRKVKELVRSMTATEAAAVLTGSDLDGVEAQAKRVGYLEGWTDAINAMRHQLSRMQSQ